MLKKTVCAFLIMLFVPVMASALSVSARVDKNSMTIDDNLILTVSVDERKAEIDTSVIKDFQIVSRTAGSSFQWINGKSSSEYTYVYTLSPLKKGKLTIPALPVQYKKEMVSTEKIDVDVDDGLEAGWTGTGNDIFVKASVNDESPYMGQQIVYTFSLFYTMQISSPSLKLPDFKNFSVKETDKDRQYATKVNGREYHVIERNVILDPLAPGDSDIPPAVLDCRVAVSRGKKSADPFDSFFNDPFFNRQALVPKTLRTNNVSVRVVPLPEKRQSIPFSGLIGRFDMEAELSPRSVGVGDSVTLSVTVKGRGNLKDATGPEIHMPASAFKMYKDSPVENISLDSLGYSGAKTFRTALVALKGGTYTVPSVSMSFFDVEKGDYKVLSSPEFTIEVTPSPDGADDLKVVSSDEKLPDIKSFTKKKVEFTGHDILPLKEALSGVKNPKHLSFSLFVLFIASSASFLYVAKLLKRLKQRDKAPAIIMVERAEKALKEARKKELDDSEFLSHIYISFVSSVLAKKGAVGESLTGKEVEDILSSYKCNEDIVEKAVKFLDHIENCRFSGQSLDSDARKNLLEDTKSIIRDMG